MSFSVLSHPHVIVCGCNWIQCVDSYKTAHKGLGSVGAETLGWYIVFIQLYL